MHDRSPASVSSEGTSPEALYSIDEFEAAARERMPAASYSIIAGGAGDGATLRRNRDAFGHWLLVPRVLVDVSAIDLRTTVLGRPIALPVLFAPAALHRLAHPDGELATARAADALGTIMVVSIGASMSIEAIGAAATAPWLQLYCFADRGLTRSHVDRAMAAGYSAICLTVDAPVPPWRERGFRGPLPPDVRAVNLPDPEPQIDAALTWRSLDWLRSLTDLPILLKGILEPRDARLAAETGVELIVVSNHGGRLLDGTTAPIDALPRVVDAVEGRMEVLVDGGIRRGGDVLKALALGARAVLIGRPIFWGLSVGGQAGVSRIGEIIRAELTSAMGLTGVRSVAEIDRSLVVREGR